MFTQHSLVDSDRLNGLLKLARKLFPVLIDSNVEVNIYWDAEIGGEEHGWIKTATPAEKKELKVDAIIYLDIDIDDWHDRDLEALIAHLLGCLEPTYRGMEDKPVVIVKENYYKINPEVANYYGRDAEIFRKAYEKVKKGKATYPKRKGEKGTFTRYRQRG